MLKEFKEFALKGSVMDLAVAVVIGGAFGKIVASLVNDIIMPILGAAIGGTNFSDLKVIIKAGTDTVPETALRYGAFIQSIIDFLLIAIGIFLILKLIDSFKKKEPQEASEEIPVENKTDTLLEEIRDILKTQK